MEHITNKDIIILEHLFAQLRTIISGPAQGSTMKRLKELCTDPLYVTEGIKNVSEDEILSFLEKNGTELPKGFLSRKGNAFLYRKSKYSDDVRVASGDTNEFKEIICN